MCNPCFFNVDYIASFEHFASETRHILKHVGMDTLFPLTNYSAYLTHEISSLIEYNFRTPAYVNARCHNKTTQLAKNLWTVFQFNGHIRDDIPFPEANELTLSSFTEVALRVVRENPMTSSEAKAQKQKYFIEGYKNIPPTVIQGIVDKYKFDFEMFGYNKVLET